jgi:DNA repair protein RadC
LLDAPAMASEPADEVEGWSIEELLGAVMTGGGSADGRGGRRARDVAVDLLGELGGLRGLSRTTEEELAARLRAAAGAGRTAPRAARGLAAAFELARRIASDTPPPEAIRNSADVAAWASPRLGGLDHEELWLLALDGRSRLRGTRCVAKGGLHGMGVRPADPLRLALRAAASGFVLVHNHPSGDPTPSREDVAFTRRVAAAAAVVGTPMLDHVVVAREGFASVPFEGDGAGSACSASLSSASPARSEA